MGQTLTQVRSRMLFRELYSTDVQPALSASRKYGAAQVGERAPPPDAAHEPMTRSAPMNLSIAFLSHNTTWESSSVTRATAQVDVKLEVVPVGVACVRDEEDAGARRCGGAVGRCSSW
jgi:hypothetical protein